MSFGWSDLGFGSCRAEESSEEEEVDTDLAVGDILESLQAIHKEHKAFD